jgi:2-polyprenyl-3-methyl-5-hydroxy-6-metoxy-1,4-benzoquinol methylase
LKGIDMNRKQSGHHKGNSSEAMLNKETIIKNLNILSGQTILDVGCGNGYMT